MDSPGVKSQANYMQVDSLPLWEAVVREFLERRCDGNVTLHISKGVVMKVERNDVTRVR